MIRIVTDSTCDLTDKLASEYGVKIVPLTVHFGEESWKDHEELSSVEFYRYLEEKEDHPKTSQPSPEAFRKVYQEILDSGDDIVSLHISSHLSGTFQSASLASKDMDAGRVTVLDSQNVCISLALIVVECAKAAKEGKCLSEIVQLAEGMFHTTEIYFIVDTLEYLQKGGRIGKGAALIGSILNIKPILMLKDGMVTPFEKARGTRKAYMRMMEVMDEYAARNTGKKIIYGITWGGNQAPLQEFMQNLPEGHPARTAMVIPIGPVVGAHAGPGALGLAFAAI